MPIMDSFGSSGISTATIDAIYPVGSVVELDRTLDPAVVFGVGTWESFNPRNLLPNSFEINFTGTTPRTGTMELYSYATGFDRPSGLLRLINLYADRVEPNMPDISNVTYRDTTVTMRYAQITTDIKLTVNKSLMMSEEERVFLDGLEATIKCVALNGGGGFTGPYSQDGVNPFTFNLPLTISATSVNGVISTTISINCNGAIILNSRTDVSSQTIGFGVAGITLNNRPAPISQTLKKWKRIS